MATREQCEKCLRKMSKAEYITFVDEFGGHVFKNAAWKTDAEFLDNNIRHFVRKVVDRKMLDELGARLRIPSDSERKRLDARWETWRSWIALVFSAIALLVSILVAIFK